MLWEQLYSKLATMTAGKAMLVTLNWSGSSAHANTEKQASALKENVLVFKFSQNVRYERMSFRLIAPTCFLMCSLGTRGAMTPLRRSF